MLKGALQLNNWPAESVITPGESATSVGEMERRGQSVGIESELS